MERHDGSTEAPSPLPFLFVLHTPCVCRPLGVSAAAAAARRQGAHATGGGGRRRHAQARGMHGMQTRGRRTHGMQTTRETKPLGGLGKEGGCFRWTLFQGRILLYLF